jgi:hypothetical protein
MFPSPWDREVPCPPEDLARAERRLREAIEIDLRSFGDEPAMGLAAAWTRVAELRLPGWCLPSRVRDEIDRLVVMWDHRRGSSAIRNTALGLGPGEVADECERLARMLAELEHALERTGGNGRLAST